MTRRDGSFTLITISLAVVRCSEKLLPKTFAEMVNRPIYDEKNERLERLPLSIRFLAGFRWKSESRNIRTTWDNLLVRGHRRGRS